MIYVCSDIHGCYDKYLRLLDAIGLTSADTLYIIGDMIDRGPSGLKLLLDASRRPNVVPLLGNHEFAAAVCLRWLTREITEDAVADERAVMEHLQDYLAWQNDGGDATLEEFKALDGAGRREVMEALLDLDTCAEVEAGGSRFVLVHAGLGNFSPSRPLEDYSLDELLFARPDMDRGYWPDRYVVFGHTPTMLLRPDKASAIYQKGRSIAIDCGCVHGGRLGCLRLDDFREFYVVDYPEQKWL